jgi:hypothetical protein
MKSPGRTIYWRCCLAIFLVAVLTAANTAAAMLPLHAHDSTCCHVCHFWRVIQTTVQVEIASVGLVLKVFILPLVSEPHYEDPLSAAIQSRGPPRIA